MSVRFIILIVLTGCSVLLSEVLLVPVQAQGPGQTTRVSVASDGTQGIYHSYGPAFSGDGRYVAFYSPFANNLVPDDTNSRSDVFVHDRQTGQTTRASIASDGTQGNGNSDTPAISHSGRYVAFVSNASNLVPGNMLPRRTVFVHDRQTGQTTRVSIAFDGTQASGESGDPAISSDGRYVAFWSYANNLVPGDTNRLSDVFVHDRQTGQTTRVSIASDGTQGNHNAFEPAISRDGRYIAFASKASNLVLGDTDSRSDIFVHDRQMGQTTRVSTSFDGTQGNKASYAPSISDDGRYVAFESSVTPILIPHSDIFVHDRQTGQTTQVSVASDGTPAGHSEAPAISGNGRYVAFESEGYLVPGDFGGRPIFVHDRQTGQTTRVSVASDGTPGSGHNPAISGDGRYVTFESLDNDLVPDDTNNAQDIFIHDRGPLLSGTASVNGRVTNSAGTPLIGILAQIYRFDEYWYIAGHGTTTPAGTFTIGSLPAGKYRVRFVDRSGVYTSEYYNDRSIFDQASDIEVTENTVIANINAVLAEVPPPPLSIGAGCGQVIINAETGQITVRLPEFCGEAVEFIAPVLCSNGDSPANVTFLLNSKAFPMTTIGRNLYKVSINVPADLPPGSNRFTVRVTAQCGSVLETPVEGDGGFYDPSGFITDAQTGRPIQSAVVNLYRAPNLLPDSGSQINGSCRTINSRPNSSGGPFGAWSGLSGTSLDTAHWVDPTLTLVNNTAAISPTINPQTTGPDGYYGWDVVRGCWYIEVQADGYASLISPLVGVPPAVTDLDIKLTPLGSGEGSSSVYLPMVIK